MTWYEEIIAVMDVGDVKTVPELVDIIKPNTPSYHRQSIRTHLYNELVSCTKYGIMRKLGKKGTNVLWERIR